MSKSFGMTFVGVALQTMATAASASNPSRVATSDPSPTAASTQNSTAAPLVLARPSPPVPTRKKMEWYGWKLLIVDGAALAAGAGLAFADARAGAITFGSGYLLGGPIVHWAHGQVGRGFLSLGGRIAIPLATGATVLGITYAAFGTMGFVGSRRSDNVFESTNMFFALGAAALVAPVSMALDAGMLARRPAAEPTKASLHWAPAAGYDPKSQRLQLGLSGCF